jgi:hypothetical protein
MKFRLVKALSPGLLVIARDGHQSLWDQAKLRRPKDCAACKRALRPGTQVFSPMTNTQYRYERLCLECVADLVNAQAKESKS